MSAPAPDPLSAVRTDPAPDPRPDLRHVDTWVFDLDETLYGRDSGVLDAMEARIEAWLVMQAGGGAAEAAAARAVMRESHGSTLGALVARGDPDIDAYLAFVHDVPLDALAPDAELRRALQRLPGRRLVHTNAPGLHAERVLAALGIDDLFEAVFHCHSAGLVLKPAPAASAAIVAAHGFDPRRAAFFEDRAANLAPAAALGMTTVLVGPDACADRSGWVDHRAPKIAPFLERVLTA